MTRYNLPVNYDKLNYKERRTVREQYIKEQGGVCYYCKSPLDGPPSDVVRGKPLNMKRFPKGFLDHPIHLHHSHDSGLTIGAVHAKCNGVLWQYHGE